jgi:type IV secretion system protein VirB10
MIGSIILAALLQQAPQQGPRSLDIDPSKVLPPVVVPAGTVIPVTLTSRISTKNSKDGDGIYGKTAFPITVDNKIVIPEGSHVRGKITEVKRPGRVKGKGELTLNFQTLVLPSGITVPIYTSLGGAGGAGERKGEATVQGDSSKGDDAKTIGTDAAGGGLIGVIGGGGKGAAVGGAGGAAVGTAAVLLSRGKDLVLEPGTTIEMVLDRPIEP